MPETSILLRVQPSPGEDQDDLDALATQLRPLAERVVAPGDGTPAKYDAVALIATLGSAGVVAAVVKIVQAYLQRDRGRKATLEFGGRKVQLDGYSGADIERILHELQSKH